MKWVVENNCSKHMVIFNLYFITILTLPSSQHRYLLLKFVLISNLTSYFLHTLTK